MRRQKELLTSIATAMICFVAVVPASSVSVTASGLVDGSLDNTFGTNGIARTDFGRGNSDYGRSVAIQSDGKTIVAGFSNINGSSDFSIVRYNTDGSLDTTFDTDGKVTTDIADDEDNAQLVALQPNGKIIVVGHSGPYGSRKLALARYNTNGTLDTTFDTDGKVISSVDIGDYAQSVDIQADGKIIVAGWVATNDGSDISVLRFNQDGSIDTTFDTDGRVTLTIGTNDYAESVVVQADGKIIVAGSAYIANQYDFAVVRYNTNGALDTTFDGDGLVTTSFGSDNDQAYSVDVHTDGKIIVAGDTYSGSSVDFALARYNTDGSLDTTFDTDGKITTDIATNSTDNPKTVLVQSDGKIVLGGSFNGMDFAVVRYNTNGALDTTFDTDGKVTTDFANDEDWLMSLALHSDGKIIATGGSYSNGSDDFAVARYNTNGALDTTFDADGKVTTNIGIRSSTDRAKSVALQTDGKIIVAGRTRPGSRDDFAVARYNTNGTLDTTFDTDGKVSTDIGNNSSDDAYSVIVQTDGKIIVAGSSYINGSEDFAMVRYNTNGSLDTTFDTDGKVTTNIGNNSNDYASSVAVQLDGRIIAAGYSDVNGERDFTVVRYNTNGTLDTTFDTDGKATTDIGNNNQDQANAIAVQTDGKIIIIGFTIIASSLDIAVVRYNTNGALDTTFDGDGKVITNLDSEEFAYSVALQTDGKIIVAGSAYGAIGYEFAVVRYNTNGALDTTFDGDGSVTTDFGNNSDDESYSVAMQTDGKIIVAGVAYSNGRNAFAVVRYNTNGSLDTTFDEDGKVTTDFIFSADGESVAVQPDGKIIVAGSSNNDIVVVRYFAAPPTGSVAPTTTTTTTTLAVTTTTAAPNRTTAQGAPALSAITSLPLAARALVSNSTLSIGQSLTVSYGGFTPGELVQLVVASTPQVIGSGYANSSGVATLTGALPSNLSAGKHTLAMYAPVSKKGIRQPITVGTPELPITGSTGVSNNLMAAMCLVAIGVGLVLARRRLAA